MMSQSSKKNTGVSPQGDRIPRGRREGSTVPAPLSSSSHDGPSAARSAGAAEENASAKNDAAFIKPAIISMARIDRPEASPGQSPLSSRKSASTSRAVSPAPSVTSTASAMDLSDVVMESDYDSTTSLGRKRKRERGRPPTTGEYIGLLQVKQRLREEEDLEEQRRQEKDILNPAATDLTARFMEELRYDPAASLAAVALEEMQRVLKVASTSKGLKGTFIKTLKESACKTSACLTNLMTRVDTAIMDSPAAETEVLRRKLEAAEKEIALLRDDIATLKINSKNRLSQE
ncbi:hypothetical protein PUN28_020398 [Cardiocondyla obscurior]|uniref:Uncharacterized protein n=1 Tax=Cardiocondyla obscurior TaxID=286306 RepID=A0AAW2E9Y6_9HYME